MEARLLEWRPGCEGGGVNASEDGEKRKEERRALREKRRFKKRQRVTVKVPAHQNERGATGSVNRKDGYAS